MNWISSWLIKPNPQLRAFSFHPLLPMMKRQRKSVLFNLSVLLKKTQLVSECAVCFHTRCLPGERSNTGRWNCSIMLPNTDSAIHTSTTSRADTEAWIMHAHTCEDSQARTLKTTRALQGFPSPSYLVKLRGVNKLRTGFYLYIKRSVQLFHWMNIIQHLWMERVQWIYRNPFREQQLRSRFTIGWK